MKTGDYVAKITNAWQKHNEWMEFPDEKPVPLGVIIAQQTEYVGTPRWHVLEHDGTIRNYDQRYLVVISDLCDLTQNKQENL